MDPKIKELNTPPLNPVSKIWECADQLNDCQLFNKDTAS
jgi:hypothetical protein